MQKSRMSGMSERENSQVIDAEAQLWSLWRDGSGGMRSVFNAPDEEGRSDAVVHQLKVVSCQRVLRGAIV